GSADLRVGLARRANARVRGDPFERGEALVPLPAVAASALRGADAAERAREARRRDALGAGAAIGRGARGAEHGAVALGEERVLLGEAEAVAGRALRALRARSADLGVAPTGRAELAPGE